MYFLDKIIKQPNLLFNARFVTTKQCTGYIPHRPSIYEFTLLNGNFTFERYLGGYYRDFIPKLMRRISRRRFDEDVSKICSFNFFFIFKSENHEKIPQIILLLLLSKIQCKKITT